MTKYERIAFNVEILRSFVAIAEQRHLTDAADTLGRTQSALSVHVRKMEDALGVRLFDRHARGMSLTAEGEKMLPVAHRVLSEMARLTMLFDAPLRGRVAVGIPDHYDDMVFETVLADFCRTYPEVDLTVTSGCSSGFSRAVEGGTLDLAVISEPSATAGVENVLEREATVWAARDGIDVARDAPVPLAFLDRGCWWSRLPCEALNAGGRDYLIKFRSTGFSSLRCAIRSGLAIGVLPARAVQPGMQIVGAAQNLPELPTLTRRVIISQKAPQDIAQEIVRKLKDGLQRASVYG